MRTLSIYTLFVLLIYMTQTSYAQPGFGTAQRLDQDWFFILGDHSQQALSGELSADWKSIQLPHDWSVLQPRHPSMASSQGFLPGGIGWYYRTLTIPPASKRYYMYLEGVYNRSQVYINGQLIGERPNGYISFYYDITDHLKLGQDNQIAIRVDHSRQADSRWYTGSGIYRDIYLIESPMAHFAPHGLFAYSHDVLTKPMLTVETRLINKASQLKPLTLVYELWDPEGQLVERKEEQIRLNAYTEQTYKTRFVVETPSLWGLDAQPLYQVKTLIKEGAEIVDSSITTSGFRDLKFDPNRGFFLNGKSYKLKGVCIHHDAGVLGAAVPKEVWRRRLLKLKEMGVNAIRTSHNPQAPDLYDLCDELGLLVMNEAFDEWEFPKRKWLEGWNVGTPGFEGSYDFFGEWGERDLEDLVKRDRNHVSIFAWSIGNEVDYPNDPYSHPVLDGDTANGFTQKQFGGYKPEAPDAMRLGYIAQRLAAVVRKWDPTRPVTAGLAGVAMSNQTAYPGALDIAGYNYTESLYDRDHQLFPDRVIYGSENRHGYTEWQQVLERDFIAGQFLWTGIDYLGESSPWPARGFYSGLLDFSGNIKPRGYFRQSLWSEAPMAYLGTQRLRTDRPTHQVSLDAPALWNYQKGDRVRVYCYTNGEEAVLFLNNKEIGAKKAKDPSNGIVFWDVPYQEGTLHVKVYKEDILWSQSSVVTHGSATSIKIEELDLVLSAARGTGHIQIGLYDKKGNKATTSDELIRCEVIYGPIRLLGLENANNRDTDDFTDAVHRSYLGQLLAYIQATGSPGTGVIRFTAKGMKPLDVTIQID
jgi:beta-galactosidase